MPRRQLNHPLNRTVLFHVDGTAKWATVTLALVEELEDLQKGIKVNDQTIVAGLFHYGGDGQETPKVTSCGDTSCKYFCNGCKCTNAGDIDFCIAERRRYVVKNSLNISLC
jgi:hypothetical protein